MRGTYTKTIVRNFDNELRWYTDDADNTIYAICGEDVGVPVKAGAVIAAMDSLGSYGSIAALVIDFYRQAAILSLGINAENIV